jgi:hypothetical protein
LQIGRVAQVRVTRSFRATPLLSLALMALACWRLNAEEAVVRIDKYRVKAAYLASFARFIERGSGATAVLCTASDINMLEAMLHLVAAKAPAVDVRSVSRPDAVPGCTVLFVGPSKLKLLRDLVGTPHESGVLIVGDGPGFVKSGGALEFVSTGNRIQFNANLSALHRCGVRVSSRLLSLARNLRGVVQ